VNVTLSMASFSGTKGDVTGLDFLFQATSGFGNRVDLAGCG